jgi:hypothetical protein
LRKIVEGKLATNDPAYDHRGNAITYKIRKAGITNMVMRFMDGTLSREEEQAIAATDLDHLLSHTVVTYAALDGATPTP